MNRRPKKPSRYPIPSAYRQAFERLDAALEENTASDNAEIIRRLRLAMYAGGDKLDRSGKVVLPP